MSPTISVIIPSYNSGPWIKQTLDSVLQQTYPLDKIELIVVDDVSKDDTVRTARSYLEPGKLHGQVVVQEKNAGPAVNRNTGWRMASGEWIQFLDHDDVLMPHKLELQAGYAQRLPDDVAVIYSSWRSLELIDGSWQPHGPVQAPNVDDDPVARALMDDRFGYVGPSLFRRSALLGVGGFDEHPNLGEDSNLMLRLAIAGGKFREAPSPGGPAFLYRQTPGSLWKSYSKNPVALWNLMLTFRMAEEHLRRQAGGGELHTDVRAALAAQYARRAPLFLEREPDKFREISGWLRRLGHAVPPNLPRELRWASSVIGYGNALRLRAKVRRLRGRDPL